MRAPSAHAARIDKRQSYIVERRDARQQVEVLKDEPNLLVARHGKRIVVETRHLIAVESIRPLRGTIEAAEDVHERGFSRA